LLNNVVEKFPVLKTPRKITMVDALPINPSVKILKAELIEPYWADSKRKIG